MREIPMTAKNGDDNFKLLAKKIQFFLFHVQHGDNELFLNDRTEVVKLMKLLCLRR